MTVTADIATLGATTRIVLASEFRDKERVKLIPGSAWSKDYELWHVPLSWGACKALRGVFATDLVVGPTLTAWAAQDYAERVYPCLNLRALSDAPGWGPEGLRPDQRVAVAMLVTGVNVVLGDDPGSGKTVIGACALDLMRQVLRARGEEVGPTLIVCPNNVKRGWERELNKWAPRLRVGIVRGTAKQRRDVLDGVKAGDYDVCVIHWENLRHHSRLAPYGSVRLKTCSACDSASLTKPASCERCPRELNEIEWGVVIADEVHRAKDPKAKQTRALWALGHQPKVKVRWGLTGTPIADAMDDYWAVGHFIEPLEYPSKTKYVDRYALVTWNAFGGMDVVGIRPDTRDEFFGFFDPRFLRRPWQITMAHLHAPTRELREVELTPKQKKVYNELADEMVAHLDDGTTLTVFNPLQKTGRLLQAAAAMLERSDCPVCHGAKERPGYHPPQPHPTAAGYCYCAELMDATVHDQKCPRCAGRGHVFVAVEPSSKLDELESILDEVGREQVVVFAVSRQVIELAAARLDKRKIANVVISGHVSEQQRYANVDAFRNGDARVCLVVIDAGGEGLDGLQIARVGVFLQRHYSRLKNIQAEGRLQRNGQMGHVVFYDIRAERTVEDDKEVILAEKDSRFEELVRDEETLRRLLSVRP